MTSEPPDASPPATAAEPVRPATPEPPGPERPAADPAMARRGFFRAFTREAIVAIGGVAATAAELQRNGGALATQLLGLGAGEDQGLVPEARVSPLAGAPGEAELTPAGVGYRSPFRLEDRTLVIVDQRALPRAVVEIRCRAPAEIVAAMRELRLRGAPVLGQVAAYGLWQVAEAGREVPSPADREAALGAAADALRAARPGVASVRQALERVLAAWRTIGGGAAGAPAEVAPDRLKAEADAIAMEALLGQARLGRIGSAALPRSRIVGGPLRILTIDETGALGGGTVGTAMGVMTTAAAEGRALEVIVAETRPTLTGARLAAWELDLAGIPTRVVADGAAPGLIAAGEVDVVLVGADTVAADGSLLNVAGTYPLALAAARAGVPFVVCTGTEAVDPDLAGAADLRPERRRFVEGSLADPDTLSGPAADDTPLVEQPLQDVTPADLISAFVTDAGILRPVFGPALAAVVWRPDARISAARLPQAGIPEAGILEA